FRSYTTAVFSPSGCLHLLSTRSGYQEIYVSPLQPRLPPQPRHNDSPECDRTVPTIPDLCLNVNRRAPLSPDVQPRGSQYISRMAWRPTHPLTPFSVCPIFPWEACRNPTYTSTNGIFYTSRKWGYP